MYFRFLARAKSIAHAVAIEHFSSAPHYHDRILPPTERGVIHGTNMVNGRTLLYAPKLVCLAKLAKNHTKNDTAERLCLERWKCKHTPPTLLPLGYGSHLVDEPEGVPER